ncbi:MAG: iron uptake porin [Pseudanabaenales cyanobacterium]|nr:iron uptake porin [Pseudanabaenales cyanobacterium]
MLKFFWKSLLVGPACLGATLIMSGIAFAAESTESKVTITPTVEESAEPSNLGVLAQINNYSHAPLQLAQVTSVSELSDVRPTDWAFTALQRLVEEYGCIEGFPNRTYRGNQAMTRYEFAAGLNACLDVIVQLISGSGTAEELATIRRLQEEFQSELATLRGRVDALEADVAELEANQFSTTTKLRGQVDAHVNVPFDEAFDDEVTTFEYRARLNFDTSFTGEDRLRLRLEAGTNDEAPVGFPGGFANSAGGDNDIVLDDVYYSFPVGDRLDIIVAGNDIATDDFVTSVIVPFAEFAVGEAAEEPLFYDFEMDGDAGAGFSYAFTDNLVLDAGYSVESDAAGDPDGQGLFGGGGQSYIAQVSYLSEGLIDAGFAFLHGNPDRDEAPTNTFAGLLNLDFGRFEVGGYGAFHDQEGSDEESFSWVAGVTFPDFFLEGNTLGAYVGQAPTFDGDEPFYAEGFYDIEVNEFLTITPAILWAEENDFETDDVDSSSVYGVLRATFRF